MDALEEIRKSPHYKLGFAKSAMKIAVEMLEKKNEWYLDLVIKDLKNAVKVLEEAA